MAGKPKEPGPSSERVAANLRRIRRERGLSTAALSARLADLGQPIQDSGITKIEKGDRRVDVDDLVALAVALDVTPNALLLPETGLPAAAASFTLTPQQAQGRPADLWAWAAGEQPLGGASASPADGKDVREREVQFGLDNRPHRHGPAASYLRDLAIQSARAGAADAGMRPRAALEISGVILVALSEGLTTGEVRDIAEGAMIAGLVMAPEELRERARAAGARIHAELGGAGQ